MAPRRQFLAGCSAAIAAMAGGRLGNLVFAGPRAASAPDHALVVVFLRGGMDGLSLVAPYDDPIYVAKRGSLALRDPLPIGAGNPTLRSSLGLHPQAAPLRELYSQNELAIVHACGLSSHTRSHFEAMDSIERGSPENKAVASGWLARHLQCVEPDGRLPVLAAASGPPESLLGAGGAVAMRDPRSYQLSGPWFYTENPDARYHSAMRKAAASFYTEDSPLHAAARRTLETIELLGATPAYSPAASYPAGSFGESLQTVAQMIKLDMGLRVATVDLGGWDHHEGQGVNERGGPFYELVGTLSEGLHAFYTDLADRRNKLTVVVISEFGRRLGRNQSDGTDHGHGNAMLVLGGGVNGGKVYGEWPGLEDERLDQREDLAIATDFRTVLSEILVRQLGNAKLGQVFPGITPQIYAADRALGIVRGPDLPVAYT